MHKFAEVATKQCKICSQELIIHEFNRGYKACKACVKKTRKKTENEIVASRSLKTCFRYKY